MIQNRAIPRSPQASIGCDSVGDSESIFLWLSVLKRCVPKTLAFAFGMRLRSKTRCFKTRVLGSWLLNGKPQERLRFRDLRSKTLAFKKRIAIISCDLGASLGARACVQVLCVQKTQRFAFAFLSPLRILGIVQFAIHESVSLRSQSSIED